MHPEVQALGSQDEVDGEAYDRFCHKQDRAFSIPGIAFYSCISFPNTSISEMFNFLESAGLNFVSFNRPRELQKFEIDSLNLDAVQNKNIALMTKMDQHAIAEIIHGSINGHSFYFSKQQNSTAELHNDLIPFLFGRPVGLEESLKKHEDIQQKTIFRASCSFEKTEFQLEFTLTRTLLQVFKYLFSNNKHTLGEISSLISESHGVQEEEVREDFKELYSSAGRHGLLLLTNKTTGKEHSGLSRGLQLFFCS